MTRSEISAALEDGTLDQIRQHGVCIVCGKEYSGNRNKRVCGMVCSEVVRWRRNRARSEVNFTSTGKRCATPRKPKLPPRALIPVTLDTDDPWMANYGGGWVNADPVLGF